MEANCTHSAQHYFLYSCDLIKQGNLDEAIKYLDLAITISDDKMEYLVKKFQLLNDYHCVDTYITLFSTQLPFLYAQLPLNIFCELFKNYLDIFSVDEEYLGALLKEHNIPAVLAYAYNDILHSTEFTTPMYYYFYAKEYDTALDYSLLHLKSNPFTLEILLLQARCLKELNDIPNSIKKYNEIIKLYPTCKDAYLELGFLNYISKQFSLAASLLKQAVKHGHSEQVCVEVIADCYLNNKEYETAINYFIRALTMSSNLTITHKKLAECYSAINKPMLSKKHLKLSAKY
ncbi:MAG: hypothetical protein BEN19_02340 [Epulopiscium sp. Nuni2H_MBin003]|nr:MAG: hypothetical protein BEN19_02340 [Epulopiscium sp. Nuni2H_MBin003]